MRIDVITLFPEFFSGPLSCGLLQRAVDKGLLTLGLHNPRLMATDRHKTVDDRPYGGGPGMVMLLEPLVKTLLSLGHAPYQHMAEPLRQELAATGCQLAEAAEQNKTAAALPMPAFNAAALAPPPKPGRILFMAPQGRPFNQALADELAQEEHLTILCGRYEGIDARLGEFFELEPVSLGDFVLNGGETAALAVIEAVGRLTPGFMGHADSGAEESFCAGLLEYPHYTRPENFAGQPVPEVLRSGDHKLVAKWRKEQSLELTRRQRPDLLSQAALTPEDMRFIQGLSTERLGRNLFCALVHYPVLDKDKKTVAVSLTNLDIHDIARSSCTYGLSGFYIVTPLQDQLDLLQQLTGHWVEGAGGKANPDRASALSLVHGLPALQNCIADITGKTGQKPFIAGTSAASEARSVAAISFTELKKLLRMRPVLLLFGTGQGLAPTAIELCDALLPPLRWSGAYNHLSVRAAAVLCLDRILGDFS